MAKVGGWELDVNTGLLNLSEVTKLIHEIDGTYAPPHFSDGSEWYPPEAWPSVEAAVKAALNHAQPYDMEAPFITAKGRQIWVRIQGFPVANAGKVTHLRGTFQDITERKQKDVETKFIGESMGFGVWKFDPVSGALEWMKKCLSYLVLIPKSFRVPIRLGKVLFRPKQSKRPSKSSNLP
jgi:hypothetical protein